MDERLMDAGDFPKVILLDTTNACNLKCSMCARNKMTRPVGRMSMKLFRKLIDEIAAEDHTARVWMVFFGEALILRYRLMWQILYAKRKGLMDVVLNSNANLLDQETVLSIIESSLDAIYIGIDAYSKETYEKVRVGGNYRLVKFNVNNLIRQKRRLGSATPKVFVQFVEMEENRHEVEPFTEYWTSRGAEVKIRPKVTWAGAVEPYGNRDVARHPCYWAMRSFNVCWDGKVALCAVDYDAQVVAGDVTKQTIQEVWLGKLKQIRDIHLTGQYESLPELCAKCMDWQMAKAEYHA